MPTMREQLVDALRAARKAGSPVVGHDPADWDKVANVAERRWRSYARRQRGRPSTRAARIEDLAVGLRVLWWEDPKLVGPLMTDIRWVATRLAAVLEPEES